MKFMRHPVADLFVDVSWEYQYDGWDEDDSFSFSGSWFRRIKLQKLMSKMSKDPSCSDRKMKLFMNWYFSEYPY